MTSDYDSERASRGLAFEAEGPITFMRGGDSQPASLPAPTATPTPFLSFWMGSFESSDHVNRHGEPLALGELTRHQSQAGADYERAAHFDMRTVRESVGWRRSDLGGSYDFTHLEERARAAAASGTQVIWTLLHYGWPRDLDILSEEFVQRFASYAGAVARFLRPFGSEPAVYAPIQEISYLTWALCAGDVLGADQPALRHRAQDVKRQLVRAALAACDAIWAVDPRARILHTDPLVHIVAPENRPDLVLPASMQREMQFEAFDMLCGRIAPELGGAPRYLDLVGLHYFPCNQWEFSSGHALAWHMRDPRRAELADLLAEVHERYARPLLLAETGHAGVGRGAWIREVAQQVGVALARGVDIEGICLHALLDRPDWDNTSHWHNAGLWDLVPEADGQMRRKLDQGYAESLRTAQASLEPQLSAPVLRQRKEPVSSPRRTQEINAAPKRSRRREVPLYAI